LTFNSRVWQQTPFQTAQEITSAVESTVFNTGSSNFFLGFEAAKETIGKYSTASDRDRVIVFFSDGHPTSGESESGLVALTKQIRCDEKTQIIGLGVGADASLTIPRAIGVDQNDGCPKAFYADVPNFGSASSEGVDIVQRILGC